MYADVVVLTYQSPDIDSYTYEIPKELEKEIKIGQLVSVPFGNRNPMGIIMSIVDRLSTIDYKVKPISSIVIHQPLLLTFQIDLLKWLRFYYLAPMVNCLEAMLPQLPNAKRLTTNANYSGFSRSTLDLSQTLILVPSINRLPEIMATFPGAKNPTVYHNELKKSERFETYLKIKSGEFDFVFGSRSAIFTPCPHLTKIIIFDEHDNAFKDERSPYYDTLTVAEKLQELTEAKIEIIDSSPKITTYFNHKSGITAQGRRTVPMVKIINMLDEKASGNRSPISEYLRAALKRNPGSSLLFLNKKNESGHLYCKNCQHQEFLKVEPCVCPNCTSSDIYFNSLNIISLSALVKKIVPQTVVRVIAEGIELSTSDFQHPVIDIATASVFYSLTLEKYALVAHVRVDSLLNVADFSSPERAYEQITDLKKLARKLLILQTYNIDNPVIKSAASSNYQQFASTQIGQRKLLAYPPYALLIKLTIRDQNAGKLEVKAKKLTADLKSQLLTINLGPQSAGRGPHGTVYLPFTILGPYQPIFAKNKAQYNIILKVPTNSYALSGRERAMKELAPYLAKVPRDWQIIVEPRNMN